MDDSTGKAATPVSFPPPFLGAVSDSLTRSRQHHMVYFRTWWIRRPEGSVECRPVTDHSGRVPDRSAGSHRCRPALEWLERKALLAGIAAHQIAFGPTPPDYFPQPEPIATPAEYASPIWADANVYRYGPAREQQLWALVPPNLNGKLDLLVHAGGFHHGHTTGVTPFTEFDMAEGTTVVSIGYRLLDQTPWPAPVDDVAEGIDDGFAIAQTLTGHRITDVTETGLSAGGPPSR